MRLRTKLATVFSGPHPQRRCFERAHTIPVCSFELNPECFKQSRRPCTEPKELDAFEVGMIENMSHDAGADVLALIGSVDNHVPDRGAVDEVGEDAAQTDETGRSHAEIATSVWISISRASLALRDLAHGACLKRETSWVGSMSLRSE